MMPEADDLLEKSYQLYKKGFEDKLPQEEAEHSQYLLQEFLDQHESVWIYQLQI